MPIYTYECGSCKEVYEIYKSMTQASRLEECVCGNKLTRVFMPLNVNGGDDGFRRTMKKPFIHKRDDGTKVQCHNWKEWEREGYRDITTTPMWNKNRLFTDLAKEKIRRCKAGDTESGVQPKDL